MITMERHVKTTGPETTPKFRGRDDSPIGEGDVSPEAGDFLPLSIHRYPFPSILRFLTLYFLFKTTYLVY